MKDQCILSKFVQTRTMHVANWIFHTHNFHILKVRQSNGKNEASSLSTWEKGEKKREEKERESRKNRRKQLHAGPKFTPDVITRSYRVWSHTQICIQWTYHHQEWKQFGECARSLARSLACIRGRTVAAECYAYLMCEKKKLSKIRLLATVFTILLPL